MFTLRPSSGTVNLSSLRSVVRSKPDHVPPSLLTATAPLISHQPVNTTGYQSASLPCATSGSPAPAISWFKDGAPLDVAADSRLSQSPQGSLEVSGLQDTGGDMLEGSYRCTATNSLGTVRSRAATLTRTGKAALLTTPHELNWPACLLHGHACHTMSEFCCSYYFASFVRGLRLLFFLLCNYLALDAFSSEAMLQ